MLTCFKCAKIIKGRAVSTNPPRFLIQLGADFPKSFHPKCFVVYQREEDIKIALEEANESADLESRLSLCFKQPT